MPERLVGVREIARLLSVSRQRADQLVRTKGFPDPIAELASGRIWERAVVVRWARVTGRSVPWATVEVELEQVPRGAPGSALNVYRDVWTAVRLQALGREPKDGPSTLEAAHALSLAEARKVDPAFDVRIPSEVDGDD